MDFIGSDLVVDASAYENSEKGGSFGAIFIWGSHQQMAPRPISSPSEP